MKKIFIPILVVFLLLLTSCLPVKVDHPLREVPTETEYQELVNSLKDSTVNLIGHYITFELSIGSGFIYDREPSKDGYYYYYVLTNNHVVDAMSHMVIKTNQGNTEIGDIYAFPVEETDTDDIAIVRFESNYDYPMINILPLDDEQNIHVQLSIGQYVFGIGTPVSKDNFNLTTDLGIISDITTNYISHTANINPGNSGGPLFSYDGTFIGINTQRVEIINGETVYLVGDAIHVHKVAEVVKRRMNNMTPKLGVIAVPYDDFVTYDYANKLGEVAKDFDPYDHVPENSSGVVLVEINVTRSSHNLLQRFDLIQKINGFTVKNNIELIDILGTIKLGDVYVFEVVRFDETLADFITLEVEVTIT